MALRRHSYKISLIAVFAALLTGAKLALSFIPNVEAVTLIIILMSSVFGLLIAVPSVLIFATVEILLYGLNYWVIAYYFYWTMLAIVFYLINRKKSVILVNVVAVILMTAFFGILTSLLDAVFLGGALKSGNFFRSFGIFYIRGIYFFLIHIVSNAVIVSLLYKPIRNLLLKL